MEVALAFGRESSKYKSLWLPFSFSFVCILCALLSLLLIIITLIGNVKESISCSIEDIQSHNMSRKSSMPQRVRSSLQCLVQITKSFVREVPLN